MFGKYRSGAVAGTLCDRLARIKRRLLNESFSWQPRLAQTRSAATAKRWTSLVAHITLGSCLCLITVSWVPLWRVERPTGHLAEIPFGSFWEFLENLPTALQNLSTPQKPEAVLTILPTVYLWENLRTTLITLLIGAGLGSLVWSVPTTGWLSGADRGGEVLQSGPRSQKPESQGPLSNAENGS